MQLAESFAASIPSLFSSEKFWNSPATPTIEFVLVEAPESAQNKYDWSKLELDDESPFVAKAADWVAQQSENFIHLRPDKLKEWKGIEQVGAPEE